MTNRNDKGQFIKGHKLSPINPFGTNARNWKGGLPKCMDCEEPLSNYNGKRCKECECKRRTGPSNYSWKGGKPKCHECGKILSNYYAKYCKSCVNKGERSSGWKGGISKNYKTGYYSAQYKQWRIDVFERDGYRCQGCTNVGGYLTAHHIKSFAHYPKLRFKLNNGITLCEECHKLTDNYKGRGRFRG